jgi:hypothetical protein
MSEISGSKEFVAFGDQGQTPPDPQPERVVMVAPDGRTVQVMTEDVAGFEELGFVLETPAVTERLEPAKPRRAKATPDEEAS